MGLGHAIVTNAKGDANPKRSPSCLLKCKRPSQFDFEELSKVKVSILEKGNDSKEILPTSPGKTPYLGDAESLTYSSPKERSHNYGKKEKVQALEEGEGSKIKGSDRKSWYWKKVARRMGEVEIPTEMVRRPQGEHR